MESNFESGLLSFRLSLLFAFALRKLDMAQFNRALEEYLWGSFTDGIPDDSAQCLGQPESARLRTLTICNFCRICLDSRQK